MVKGYHERKIFKFFTLPFSVLPFILGKKSSTCIPRIKTVYHCLIKESITLKLVSSVTMAFCIPSDIKTEQFKFIFTRRVLLAIFYHLREKATTA